MQIVDGSTIGFGAQYIAYRADGGSAWSLLDKDQVKLLQANFVANYKNESNGYPHQNRLAINIPIGEGRSLSFDVQDTETVTWLALGGTIAALNLAVTDISNW